MSMRFSPQEYRFKKGISQYIIQAASGVFQSRLSLIENGLAKPTEKEMTAIADALGVEPNEIAWPTVRRSLDRESKARPESKAE